MNILVLVTNRLILRPWREDDAYALFAVAKSPNVGPMCGWNPHKDIEESRQIIKDVLMVPECYAICLKEIDVPIGCITLKLKQDSQILDGPDEGEIGFWLGEDFWGQGIIPEAANELIKHAFKDLNLKKIKCAYFEGNEKSKRVQEKIGFKYIRKGDYECKQLDRIIPSVFQELTLEEWNKKHKV